MSVTAPPLFAVYLTAYEVRALANIASLLDGSLDLEMVDPPAGHSIPPLQSAQLKLEMALVLAGEER